MLSPVSRADSPSGMRSARVQALRVAERATDPVNKEALPGSKYTSRQRSIF